MKLNKLYSLRRDFTIIGLTGRVGSGCSEIAKKLSNNNFIDEVNFQDNLVGTISDDQKLKICYEFLKADGNWRPFTIINYKNILLFHLIHHANKFEDYIAEFLNIIFQYSEFNSSNRFNIETDFQLHLQLKSFLEENRKIFISEEEFGCENLNDCLYNSEKEEIVEFFFGETFKIFADDFFKILNNYNITKRTRLVHDLANNLRSRGSVALLKDGKESFKYIYIIAETINRIIKALRKKDGKCHIVIDALKNSLELLFFKEKYSAFYMIATNKEEFVRKQYVVNQILTNYGQIASDTHSCEIISLDDTEYKSNDHKRGKFSTPDIENCIQKSDYHLFINTDKSLKVNYLGIDTQLIKLIALIKQPGIITPTGIERTMQVAYNAKFNSGCISRQVGAVITDSNFTIKSIGWNDVAQGQVPCNLRNANDLLKGENSDLYSDFEKGAGQYNDGKTFLQKFTTEISKGSQVNLQGRNCSFCFKSFHNAFESEKNQVHTRSLHAEENAMMQLVKYGGIGVKGGNLFTTASPCELCSKKAFQLGISNIYYIDPYPGIATMHTLKNGFDKSSNPKLIMFQGAVGRAFHKLYEPFMAYKDELSILTGINPKESIEDKIKNLIKNKELRDRLIEKIKDKSENEKTEFLEKHIGILLEKSTSQN